MSSIFFFPPQTLSRTNGCCQAAGRSFDFCSQDSLIGPRSAPSPSQPVLLPFVWDSSHLVPRVRRSFSHSPALHSGASESKVWPLDGEEEQGVRRPDWTHCCGCWERLMLWWFCGLFFSPQGEKRRGPCIACTCSVCFTLSPTLLLPRRALLVAGTG